MDIQLKQRLIGTVVIFSLLIIFLPMFFENNSNNILDDNSEERLEQLLAVPVAQEKASLANKENNLENNNGLEQQFIFNNAETESQVKNTSEPVLKTNKTNKTDKDLEQNIIGITSAELDKLQSEPEKISSASNELSQEQKLKRVIKFNLPNNISRNDVYAVRISSAQSSQAAEKLKAFLQSIGFPAYTNQENNKTDFSVYIGPDFELKYIKELANRILDETDYQPEIVAHNKSWLTKK
ncbi:MAG: hypothetical protein KBD64_01800 [Gammaproteobacteria bacterium]|nr:hypothetical protein [Gammaproteobacteria bacterium]